MSEAKMGVVLNEMLKSICCSNGWSYAVFWRFDHRNSMLLTMENAYYEEQMRAVVDDMRLQVHMLGEGIVGQVASTGKHQWFFSDAYGGWNSTSSVGSQDIFQDNCEIHHQFSRGIKTIAVISVESQGVIQFGSSKKILERQEFLDQIKKLIGEMENVGLTSSVNESSSLNCENYDLNEWFSSFCNGNITPMHGSSCNELMEMAYTSINLTQSSSFISNARQERISPLCWDSCHSIDPLHSSGAKAQVISSRTGTQLQPVGSQAASSVDKSAAKVHCISACSNESSILTSLESQLPSEMVVHNSLNMLSTSSITSASCGNKRQVSQGESTYSTRGLVDVEKTVQEMSGKLKGNQHSALPVHATEGELPERQTNLRKIPEQFKPPDFTTELSDSCIVDNLLEWYEPSPEFGISAMASIANENLSQSVGVTSVSSGLVGNALLDNPFQQPSNSVQSSVIETHACGGQQKSVILNCAQNDLLEGLALEFGFEQARDCWENMIPMVNGSHLAAGTGVSDSISVMDVGSMVAPRKGLFSELGLEELLESVSNSNYVSKSSTDDATKRRRVENSSVNERQVHLGSVSCSGSSTTMQSTYTSERKNNLLSKKEGFPKSQVGSWIDDSYSINNGCNVQAKHKKPEEATKTTRKRARPGESTRPRPKDRQQIQDRLKELKGIIPGGEKCSIDALLDRTIKHMLFLQGVTKYADKLKHANEPKLIGQDKGMVLKDNNTRGSGATWALEVGDQTAVCPIIVEDISPPGLMLIEMICEGSGFFLEIADVIRGFGLNILKGMMESREEKIWARFIVEANTHLTRIEIFWSLVELMERTRSSGMGSTNQPCNIMNGRIPLLNNYQQPALPHPVSLAEALQ